MVCVFSKGEGNCKFGCFMRETEFLGIVWSFAHGLSTGLVEDSFGLINSSLQYFFCSFRIISEQNVDY